MKKNVQLEAAEAALAAAAKARDAALAARAAEATRLAATRCESDATALALKAADPDGKEFKALANVQASLRERLEVLQSRIALAQGAVDQAEAVVAAETDTRDRAALVVLDEELEREEASLAEWLTGVRNEIADRVQAFDARRAEAVALDDLLGRTAGHGQRSGGRHARWFTSADVDPFAAAAAYRTWKRAQPHLAAARAAEVKKNFLEAVALRDHLAAEEASRQRFRERHAAGTLTSDRAADRPGRLVSELHPDRGNA